MEALTWNFFVAALLSLLTKHSCQVPADRDTRTLSPPPIILLQPAASGISYEALQYPVPMDQYQLIPLVINTGKIPLINHAVQAPIQYFVAGDESQRVDPARRSTTATTTQQQQRRGPKPVYSDAARTENRPARDYNDYSPRPPTAYGYGYKTTVDGRHESRRRGGPGDGPRAGGGPRSPVEKTGGRDGAAPSTRPIVVRPDPKTAGAELKKRYKTVGNGTKSSETPINAANENGILTTSKP